MEKNKFLKLLFSFIPGAGYMYLNMMAKGTVFMLGAAALLIASMGYSFNALIVFMPVIWCYTFFDTFHMGSMDYETRVALDHEFIANIQKSDFKAMASFAGKKQLILGWIAMLLAMYLVIYSVIYPLLRYYINFEFIYVIMDVIPSVIVVVLLFALGKYLIKKDKNEDFLPFKGRVVEEKQEEEIVILEKEEE